MTRIPLKRKHVLFAWLIVLLILIVGYIINVYSVSSTFDPQSELQSYVSSDTTVFEILRSNVGTIIERGGVEGMMELLRLAKAADHITINDCHTVMHLVGHEAYHYYEYDLQKLAQKYDGFCGGAYYHGIEAEIVAVRQNLPDIAAELEAFCSIATYDCYHGAGHEFMGTSLNVVDSLASCDFLQQRTPQINLLECYKGVFSETAFQIAGIDGDTGLHIAGEPLVTLQELHPLDYCQKLDARYQEACALQLSRASFGKDKGAALEKCLLPKYSEVLQAGCVQVAAASIAQYSFDNTSKLHIEPIVFTLPEVLRHAYIRGAVGEFSAFISTGLALDRSTVCLAFNNAVDEAYCHQLIEAEGVL